MYDALSVVGRFGTSCVRGCWAHAAAAAATSVICAINRMRQTMPEFSRFLNSWVMQGTAGNADKKRGKPIDPIKPIRNIFCCLKHKGFLSV
jgi:hypothetical protein